MKKLEFYVSNKTLLEAYIVWYTQLESAKAEGKEAPQIPPYIVDCMMKICSKLQYRPNFIGYSYRDAMVSDALYDCIRFATKFNPGKKIFKVTFKMLDGDVKVKEKISCEATGISGKITYYNPATGLSSLKMDGVIEFGIGDTVKSESGATAQISEVNSHYANNPFAFFTTIAFNAFLRRIDTEKMEAYIRSELISKTPMSEFLNSQNQDDTEFVNSYVEFLRDTGYNDNHLPQSIKKSNAKKMAKLAARMEAIELGVESPFAEFEEDFDIGESVE